MSAFVPGDVIAAFKHSTVLYHDHALPQGTPIDIEHGDAFLVVGVENIHLHNHNKIWHWHLLLSSRTRCYGWVPVYEDDTLWHKVA